MDGIYSSELGTCLLDASPTTTTVNCTLTTLQSANCAS